MSPDALGKVLHFTCVIIPIVFYHEGFIHSWIRCKQRNDEVDGHPQSRHLVGTAVDVGFYTKEERDRAYEDCYEHGLHGQKKEWFDWRTEAHIFGFHMQLEEPRS